MGKCDLQMKIRQYIGILTAGFADFSHDLEMTLPQGLAEIPKNLHPRPPLLRWLCKCLELIQYNITYRWQLADSERQMRAVSVVVEIVGLECST